VGAPGHSRLTIRFTFFNSSIRFTLVWRRPAVSMKTTSVPLLMAEWMESKATAEGSDPWACLIRSAPARFAQTSSCSTAAALKVSAAR